MAAKFHQMTGQIEAALSRISYMKLGIPEEVREQVKVNKIKKFQLNSVICKLS